MLIIRKKFGIAPLIIVSPAQELSMVKVYQKKNIRALLVFSMGQRKNYWIIFDQGIILQAMPTRNSIWLIFGIN